MSTNEYLNSDQHLANVLAARQKAVEHNKLTKLNRIANYELNPKSCAQCGNPLPYNKQRNKFCSKSCSATYNNLLSGPLLTSTRQRISKSLKQFNLHHVRPDIKIGAYSKLYIVTCKICNKVKLVNYKKKNHKTCGSADCKVVACVKIRQYQNGSRKPVWFYNPYEDKDVLLESSWEVEIAEYLIKKDIEWIRPPHILWEDQSIKVRRYFPDFYLPKYNVYLDPKNPYCLKQDEEKMQAISDKVSIVYGSLNKIKSYIDMIV
jgi:hypothetical protein